MAFSVVARKRADNKKQALNVEVMPGGVRRRR
jgi:hypothetical protein